MAHEVSIDSTIPIFESIESLQDRSSSPAMESLPVDTVVVDMGSMESQPVLEGVQQGSNRKRGRPKGSRNRPKDGSSLPIETGVETKLSGRLAKDVSLRGQQVLKGISHIPALWVPPFEMQDEEAQNIADPLASYATRKAEESSAVGEFLRTSLENFDLLAAIIGISSYAIRVGKDIREYNEYHRTEQQVNRRAEGIYREPDKPSRSQNQVVRESRKEPEPPQQSNNDYPNIEFDASVLPISTPVIGQL